MGRGCYYPNGTRYKAAAWFHIEKPYDDTYAREQVTEQMIERAEEEGELDEWKQEAAENEQTLQEYVAERRGFEAWVQDYMQDEDRYFFESMVEEFIGMLPKSFSKDDRWARGGYGDDEHIKASNNLFEVRLHEEDTYYTWMLVERDDDYFEHQAFARRNLEPTMRKWIIAIVKAGYEPRFATSAWTMADSIPIKGDYDARMAWLKKGAVPIFQTSYPDPPKEKTRFELGQVARV